METLHPGESFVEYKPGVSWLHKRPERWQQMREGAELFKEILDAKDERNSYFRIQFAEYLRN